jgi:hypothetical protein
MVFLALGGFYHDFCRVAWGEPSYPNCDEWAEQLGLGAFRLGQLAGTDFEPDESDEEVLVSDALRLLANEARPAVVEELQNGFGGSSGLFLSPWRSKEKDPGEEPDDATEPLETDDDIMNHVTSDKMPAFEWIEGGPHRRWKRNSHAVLAAAHDAAATSRTLRGKHGSDHARTTLSRGRAAESETADAASADRGGEPCGTLEVGRRNSQARADVGTAAG